VHYIDEVNGLLVLTVVSGFKHPNEDSPKVYRLRIEMATGRPIESKRDLFAQLRVFSSVDSGKASEVSNASPGNPACNSRSIRAALYERKRTFATDLPCYC
jgi:hypothetical protein